MIAWGHSDVGKVRRENQDSYAFNVSGSKKCGFAIVCDGMGGAAAGNIASRIALEEFKKQIENSEYKAASEEQLKSLLDTAANSANLAVYEHAGRDRKLHGMGTTLVAAVISSSRIGIINIGDSRAYKISGEGIVRITRDHSLVEDMVLMGELTEKQAQVHPGKNLITRAVGTDRNVSGDVYFPDIKSGEYILLCTDGLSNLVTEHEILYEVLYGGKNSDCCKRLIDIANSRGGYDNITAVLLSV